MSRVKLDMPSLRLATVHLPVRITDLNYGNHVGNATIVEYLHEARVQFLKKHSFSEMDAGGIGLIMSDLAIEYKNESFYGDRLIIHVYCGEISRVSFQLYYKIELDSETGNKLIANAKTGMVGFNYTDRKVAALPEALLQILSQPL